LNQCVIKGETGEHLTMLDMTTDGAGASRSGRRCATRGRGPDPELPERPQRRRFTAEHKPRILREAHAAARPG
jgi:hypothetical protein